MERSQPYASLCLAAYFSAPAPSGAVVGDGDDWEEWLRATCVLLQRVHPVPVIRGWVREITASQPVARTERRVAEHACALWAVLGGSAGHGGRSGCGLQALRRHRGGGAQGPHLKHACGVGHRGASPFGGAVMAVPGGDECVPLLAAALERGGKLAPLALPICPIVAGRHGLGAPGLYLAA